ncbi:hypothetical protein SAMN06265360_106253 [Haloechinothrix alba]|uniref:Uncharacterized protein n=1 Tax=Haloechinothrix alba TaxID=664784 RepID=A0A238WK45_9PSEU|nr:hypothetical protein SAMN06265360_106253 [Haloechinothrix alba]
MLGDIFVKHDGASRGVDDPDAYVVGVFVDDAIRVNSVAHIGIHVRRCSGWGPGRCGDSGRRWLGVAHLPHRPGGCVRPSAVRVRY